jgi:hypothetical protein
MTFGDMYAAGSEPNAPALHTAEIIAGVAAPAMGAWINGHSMPSKFISAVFGNKDTLQTGMLRNPYCHSSAKR